MKYIIANANIVNEGKIFKGSVIIEDNIIKEVGGISSKKHNFNAEIIDAKGKYLLPGIIDTHVHFREPGLTHKADIYTESKAAVAGGVTSFMDMPNTIPNTITNDLLEEKFKIASQKSLANYSFYIGASNNNIDELKLIDNRFVCGIKVFMGSSTGNMLVNNISVLNKIFSIPSALIAVHCENEQIINENLEKYKIVYGENIPVSKHPFIRNSESCFKSVSQAIILANKYNTRLHLLHLSSADEMKLLDNSLPTEKKKITSEVCINHLWFSSKNYKSKGTFLKVNPAIKTNKDKLALSKALNDGKIDTIASDHAPHTIKEKNDNYLNVPSGAPSIQHSLVSMLELYHQRVISLENIVNKMAHAPAICFNIEKRGFIRSGYYADLVLVDINSPWKVDKSNILSKCRWSLFESNIFKACVTHTFVNGNLIYNNGIFNETAKGSRLLFKR